MKQFSTAAVLSVWEGHLFISKAQRALGENGMKEVYEILNFMTNDNLFTHALPRASVECYPYLTEQIAWLTDEFERVPSDSKYPEHVYIGGGGREEVNRENHLRILTEVESRRGEFQNVRPIHSEDHAVIDPIQEAIDMVGIDRVIKIELDGESDEPSPYGDLP